MMKEVDAALSAGHRHQAGSVTRPRIVIAAPQGRSGKTTVSLGICAALAERGLRVQAFRKGRIILTHPG